MIRTLEEAAADGSELQKAQQERRKRKRSGKRPNGPMTPVKRPGKELLVQARHEPQA